MMVNLSKIFPRTNPQVISCCVPCPPLIRIKAHDIALLIDQIVTSNEFANVSVQNQPEISDKIQSEQKRIYYYLKK